MVDKAEFKERELRSKLKMYSNVIMYGIIAEIPFVKDITCKKLELYNKFIF